ncbi:MAG: UDP-glucose 4-epimerase GalE [Bacteriovoracaceae bacterium]|jgi:UDP-glucose 4-epimerase|nr:UDP-glucose 4-epimerase GalE [Bacteriovoracaceae bacterium]
MGKILVTGGAGYIGSHVVKCLGEEGFEIVVYDNLSTGRRENVLFGEFVEGHLEDQDSIEQLFKDNQFVGVLHFAGSIVVPDSVSDPLSYYSNNTVNSFRVINLCKKYGVPNFIFSSTAAVYGMLEDGVADEQAKTSPINPYGHSKLMTEQMLKDTSFAHEQFNYIALRYFNVSGADPSGQIGQCFPGATHLIKVACETALGKREGMKVFGTDYETADGTCIRDYIHVQDLAMAHVNALKYLLVNKKSHILNCGYGTGFSVNEVLNIVKEISGVDFRVELAPRRPGDASVVMSKCGKIKEVLGWEPKYQSLKIIVETALNWEKKLGELDARVRS